MDEKMYFMLLERSRDFCKCLNVDYIDFLHDVICETPTVNEDTFRLEFTKKKYAILHAIKHEPLENIGSRNYISLYKYCILCDSILPEREFYEDQKICKECYHERSREYKRAVYKPKPKKTPKVILKAQEELRDNYILRVFKKCGIDNKDVSPEMIEDKRQQILNKRNRRKVA